MDSLLSILDMVRVVRAVGEVTEVRVLGLRRGVALGFFDDFAKLEAALRQFDGAAKGVYFTLNPADPSLLARSNNRMTYPARSGDGTSDRDIVRRRWLLIDADPIRAAGKSGISATDEEHAFARRKVDEVRLALDARGWPSPLICDSGNGYHLLYRIDLPNDEPALVLIEKVLAALDLQFSDARVAIDTNVANASRIVKAYGTVAKKGDETVDRPHRRSGMLTCAHATTPVSEAQLSTFAQFAPSAEAPKRGQRKQTRSDVATILARHKVHVAYEGPWLGGGYKWVLAVCPWNPEHGNRSAFVVQLPNGAVAAGCHHNSCAGRDWRALRRGHFGPDTADDRVTVDDPRTIIVEELNAHHFVIHVGKKSRKTLVGHDADFPPTFESFESLRNFHLNNRRAVGEKQDGTPILESVANVWLRHPQRRTYTGELIFAPPPLTCKDEDYNLWQGFPYESDKGADPEHRCALFLAHLKEVICGRESNPEVYEFLLDVLAAKVQRPGLLTEVAIVLRGEQGAGKNTFANEYGALFGDRHYCTVEKLDQVVGRFNAALSAKLVVILDEAFWAGGKDFLGALKALITSPRLMIERKGIDPDEEINAVQTFVLTNNLWAWPTELRDRRALVLDVSSHRIGDTDYFRRIYEEMTRGGRAALLTFLQQRTITHDLRRIPHTEARGVQEDLSHDPVTRWWKAKLDRGHTWDEGDSWSRWISTKDAYDDYKAFLTRPERPLPFNSFVSSWKMLLPNPEIDTCKRSGIVDRCEQLELQKRGRPLSEGKQLRRPGLTIPDLWDCREAYDKLSGSPPTWPLVFDDGPVPEDVKAARVWEDQFEESDQESDEDDREDVND